MNKTTPKLTARHPLLAQCKSYFNKPIYLQILDAVNATDHSEEAVKKAVADTITPWFCSDAALPFGLTRST